MSTDGRCKQPLQLRHLKGSAVQCLQMAGAGSCSDQGGGVPAADQVLLLHSVNAGEGNLGLCKGTEQHRLQSCLMQLTRE